MSNQCSHFRGTDQPAKDGAEGKAGEALKKAVAELQGTWTLYL